MATIDNNLAIPSTEDTVKTVSPLQQGLALMKDNDVLLSTKNSLNLLADLVQSDSSSKGFDAIHANIPWKTVSTEYLVSLPVKKLVVNSGDISGLLLWVDSNYADKAIDVIRAWGFEFKSVLQILSYDKPALPAKAGGVDKKTTAKEDDLESKEDGLTVEAGKEEDDGDDKDVVVPMETESVSSALPPPRVTRKQCIPPGWSTDGVVPSRTRQLWYAETVATGTGESTSTRYLKDTSFIRKRLPQVATFVYPPEEGDEVVSTLSAKKKNLENWRVFPDHDVYLPQSTKVTLEQIFRPSARVLSLFADGLNRNWFTWGPNVPGYFCGPLRNDSGFVLPTVLMKHLGSMKILTTHKYLTLVNQYAIQLAKQLGSSTNEVAPLVEGRLCEFIDELRTRAETGGGLREDQLATAAKLQLISSETFKGFDPVLKTQVLLMIAQVIRAVFRRNAEAADRRKRAPKRKREGDDETQQVHAPRKFGIAAPVNISSELAGFMGLEQGAKVARTTVVKFINEYISKQALQNPEKKSNIVLDEPLTKLLQPEANFGPVTYFNLCKLLGPHFLPTPKLVEAQA